MKIFTFLITLSFVGVSLIGLCQFGGGFPVGGGGGGNPIMPFGGGGQPCGAPFEPCPIPLDGGASILLLAGLAFGGKKVHDRNKSDLNK